MTICQSGLLVQTRKVNEQQIKQEHQSKTNQADPLKLPTDPHDNLSKRNDNADQISQSTTEKSKEDIHFNYLQIGGTNRILLRIKHNLITIRM